MDEIDRHIVSRLMNDGREPYVDLGRAVGLSQSAVKRRVDRLVGSGAIRGFVAVVDPVSLGWSLTASVELYIAGTVSLDRIRGDLDAIPEVASAFATSGQCDAMVRVLAADAMHLERVVNRLRGLDYVRQTNTVLLLSSLVSRPDPPPAGRGSADNPVPSMLP